MTAPIDRESVERFDPQLDKNGRPVLVGHHKSNGFWVKYDDFCAALDAAEAENKRLRRLGLAMAEIIAASRPVAIAAAICAQGEDQ